MKKILEKIKEYSRIIILGHVRPDGDCIGSQFGLYELLKENFPKKEIYISGESSDSVKFIGAPSLVPDDLFPGALILCLDCATKDRLSDQRYSQGAYVIKIDHHIVVDSYGDMQYVDEESPACAQIITQMAFEFGWKWNLAAATALYVGIYTDTGRFKFDSVRPETFLCAAKLLGQGISLQEIENQLSVETMNNLKLKGYVLSNFKVTENGFAYITLKRNEIEQFHVSDEEAASQVSTISTIEGCPVWAIFLEYPHNEIRIRLRSRGPMINKLAEEYHGGGHAKASGARLDRWEDLEGFVKKADLLVLDYFRSLTEK